MRSNALIIIPCLLLALIIYAAWQMKDKPAPPPKETMSLIPGISDLGKLPDWSDLEASQESITREDFKRELETVFTVGNTWVDYISITYDAAYIRTNPKDPSLFYQLRFAKEGSENKANPKRYWREAAELSPISEEKPLSDIHIALDPGHIGGAMAKMEERWFQIGEDTPVMEGEMTLLTAKLLKKRLEKLGARVSLVRDKNEPVNSMQPAMFEQIGKERSDDPATMQRIAERLFYRTAEIRERGRLVNTKIQPDVVICLHFNAVSWGDPDNPTLRDENHLHILLHGALTKNEVARADERYDMIQKIVQRIHPEEKAISASVAKSFVDASGLLPYTYEPNSKRAINIDNNPYLWSRNLLANRIYYCPVIYMEPYVMNSHAAYKRIQMGDYEGVKTVNGLPRKSIFREYADAIAEGLKNYYAANRPTESNSTSTQADE